MSGHRRLLDIGLTKLFTPSGVNGAINHLIRRLELRKNSLSTRLVPVNLERRARERAQAELWKKDPVVRKLETDIQVARYINEQLQLTPWNLTNNYVECHLQGKGSGMLQLGGIGDPTGRGEGFSFVRVPQSRAKKKDGEDDVAPTAESKISAETAAVQKAVAAVTGTTADLRKLKMKEAGDVLRNLGLADADIKKLRRWDRIHMVRELSSRATAHGVAGSLSKFARGARKSLSAQQQEYRKKCDVIYERQMDVLSAAKTTFSSDEESDGDDELDELGADVEADILGGTDTKRGPKNLFRSGGGGLNRSKEVLAEREDAVELRRLMEEMNEDQGSSNAKPASAVRRPDLDTNRLRNQLRASGIREGGTGASGISSVSNFGARSNMMSRGGSTVSSALATPTGQLSRVSSPTHGSRTPVPSEPPSASKKIPGRKVLKRVVRTIEEDGSETVRIQFIVDDKQVARFRAMQQRKERQQKADERNQLRKRKRMLALEDDSTNQSLLDKAKRRKQLQEELKQLQKTEAQNKGYQEMLKKGESGEVADGTDGDDAGGKGVIRCTQCLQVGHMRTNRSCPLYMADDSRSKKSGALSEKQANAMLAEPLKLKVKKAPAVIRQRRFEYQDHREPVGTPRGRSQAPARKEAQARDGGARAGGAVQAAVREGCDQAESLAHAGGVFEQRSGGGGSAAVRNARERALPIAGGCNHRAQLLSHRETADGSELDPPQDRGQGVRLDARVRQGPGAHCQQLAHLQRRPDQVRDHRQRAESAAPRPRRDGGAQRRRWHDPHHANYHAVKRPNPHLFTPSNIPKNSTKYTGQKAKQN
ncbi:hypothetical protein ON010_g17251 [Phytophthora cinnamomi]|nr:hypothetical protein ON010_g17251 [Phytophthora cinnamomi]